jgi:PKD repeat protein
MKTRLRPAGQGARRLWETAARGIVAVAIVAGGALLFSSCDWPFGSFSASPSRGNAPLTVQFTPRATARVAEWYWDFGDGTSSDSRAPSHTYTTPGKYTVALSITYTTATYEEAFYVATEPDCVIVRGNSPAGGGKMYVTNQGNNTISCANLDGTGTQILTIPAGILDGPIDIDIAQGKMYVIDSVHVAVANVDGTEWKSLGTLGGALLPGGIMGIAVDATHGKMYVLENHDRVIRANLDGTGAEDLGSLNGTLNGTHSIALDVARGKMYVTNGGGNSVSRANLDGTGGENLRDLNGTVGPYDIALDLIHDKMYVLTALSTLIRANLDGTGAEDLGSGEWPGPSGIALDVRGNKMYVVCNSLGSAVVSANLNGESVLGLGTLDGTLNMPWRIAIVPAD